MSLLSEKKIHDYQLTWDQFMNKLKEDPDYLLLVEAIELDTIGGKRMRKRAAKKGDEFRELALTFSETKKRAFVHLCAAIYNLPYYFPWDVIQATLEKWIKDEPQDSEPLKFFLIVHISAIEIDHPPTFETIHALMLFVALNPADDHVIRELIEMILASLTSTPHQTRWQSYNFPEYFTESLKLCSAINDYLNNLQDKDAEVRIFAQGLEKVRICIQGKIEKYQEYIKANVNESFSDWYGVCDRFDPFY